MQDLGLDLDQVGVEQVLEDLGLDFRQAEELDQEELVLVLEVMDQDLQEVIKYYIRRTPSDIYVVIKQNPNKHKSLPSRILTP